MKNQWVRRAFFLVVASLSVVSLLPRASAAAGRATKCASLFLADEKRSTSASPKTTLNSVVSVDPRAAIVVRGEEPSPDRREMTLFGDPSLDGRATPVIPDSHIKRIRLTKTSEGDFIEAEIYTHGSPYISSQAGQTKLANGLKANPSIGYAGSSVSKGISTVAVVPQQKSHAMVSESESRRLVRELVVEKDAAEARLDASMVEMIVEKLHRDPQTLARALQYSAEKKERGANFIADSPVLTLSNVGLHRYFRFRPDGSGTEVEARVHDINRKKNPEVVNILIEWLEVGVGDGPRVRRIASLTVEDLATVRLVDEIGRREIATNFEDLLSLNEVRTRRFANNLGLKTVGISQYDPNGHTFETRGGRVNMIIDPYTAVTGHSSAMGRVRFESTFGSAVDLFTTAEAQDPRVNMFDVTSRLNPGFVLKRLSAERSTAKFAFVVTEDGQLKIAAHLPDRLDENPDYLRLGHGRRIFLKGLFEVDRDGSIRVTSTRIPPSVVGYGEDPVRNAAASARLIAAAFAAQAGRRVLEVEGVFMQRDPLAGFSNVSAEKGQWASTDFYDSSWSAFTGRPDSYVPPVSSRGSKPTNVAGPRLVWDSAAPTAKPLSYEAWEIEMRKLFGRELNSYDEGESKVGWAHYVLKSNPNMSKDAIRKNYRKLASRFHGDTHGNKIEDRDDIQNVNSAWQTIEAVFADGAQR